MYERKYLLVTFRIGARPADQRTNSSGSKGSKFYLRKEATKSLVRPSGFSKEAGRLLAITKAGADPS